MQEFFVKKDCCLFVFHTLNIRNIIGSQFIAYNPTKSVKALAHIGRLGVKKKSGLVTDQIHGE